MRLVAFYLPQFYPTETNDKWYGKGFTEWTNVAAAKKLFKGHYEPHIPSELGFYDLRVPEVRREQARMAQECGIEAFCYWTYWFGDGVCELDMPLWKMYEDKEITLPFCLAWANTSWEKKKWNKNAGKNDIIHEQKYLGVEDYKKFFYHMLPLFRDPRYYRVDGKVFFVIHYPLDNSNEVQTFMKCWRKLAQTEGLGDFYFTGSDSDSRNKEKILSMGFDSIYNMNAFNIHHHLNLFQKILLKIGRDVFKRPTVFRYKDAIEYMLSADSRDNNVIPVLTSNWDHSPRSGSNAIILRDCEPRYFKKLLEMAKEVVSEKKEEEQIVFIQAWNEWGEGNHLEPDLKYGRGYLDAIAEVMNKDKNND